MVQAITETALPGSAAELAAELPKRVSAFFAGDELYSGQWLTNFQRTACAWEVCVEALRPGPLPTCDDQLLQEFCSQTLARLARSFGHRHERAQQRLHCDVLCSLLAMFSTEEAVGSKEGLRAMKQLALAATSASLWLGCWTPPAPQLSAAARLELLSLPVDLLFCDKALPLDAPLRQAAAGALLDNCGAAFEELVSDSHSYNPTALRVIAGWLAALRKAVPLIATCDEAAPLAALAAHGERLVPMVQREPGMAAEIVLQLARWQQIGRDDDLARMLSPLLERIFESAEADDCGQLLPLLAELAAGCWPRAAFHDFALDWQALTQCALVALRATVAACEAAGPEPDDAELHDAMAALGVWQTIATTIVEGTASARCDEEEDDEAERPEKRLRVRAERHWRAEPEAIRQCEALPQIFGGFAQALIQLLRIRDPLDDRPQKALTTLRTAAHEALEAWARLLGDGPALSQAFAPLQQLAGMLSQDPGEFAMPDEEAWADVEVVLWLSSVLAQSRPAGAPAAAAVLSMACLDTASEPWHSWLCASAVALVSAADGENVLPAIEWALERPASATFAPEFLQFTELPYAQGLARLCSKLPAGAVHAAIGERLAALAFSEREQVAMHKDVVQAQALMLQAMRDATGGDANILCHALSSHLLPALRAAVDAEIAQAMGHEDLEWHSAQVLFATLTVALPSADSPSADSSHPALALWKEHWSYLEAALLHWTPSGPDEQPLAAAAAAATAAAAGLPELVPEVLPLLAQSVMRDEPQVQLEAMRQVCVGIRCPPCDPGRASDFARAAVVGALESLLLRQGEVLSSPGTLAELFRLLGECVRPPPKGCSGSGLCADQLRPKILEQTAVLSRCLAMVPLGLQDCTSAEVSASMFRFVANVVGVEELPQGAKQRPVLVAVLPELCRAVFLALATLPHLPHSEGLASAAELLLGLAAALPAELPGALAAGMALAQVPAWSGEAIQRHIAGRSTWQKQGEWLEEFRHIVCELQRQHRKVEY